MTLYDITERLDTYGYAVTDFDKSMINFLIRKTEYYIADRCNTSEIPDGLEAAAIDFVLGEFMLEKKAADSTFMNAIDFEPMIKGIQEGDTNVTYAVGDNATPEQRFDTLVNRLTSLGEKDFAPYRKMRW